MQDVLRNERLKKLQAFKDAGIDPYPATASRTHHVGELVQSFSAFVTKKRAVAVLGRITGFRNQGSVAFFDLRDESGTIQLVAKKDEVKNFALFRDNLDLGDFIGAKGTPFVTKRGEKSILVKNLTILTKSLLPLPSEWHGLTDVETRLRKRYLDILSHAELAELFRQKARFWDAARSYLKEQGFLEVETPVLEVTPGGAEAEPFVTHHHALDKDFYLRISLELPLKRLMVAGYEKVFEIGRIFRNEGIDAEHLQDYTQLEFYVAYNDYEGLMKFVEVMVKKMVKETKNTLTTTWKGEKIQWGKKWPRLDYYQLFKKGSGIDLASATTDQLFEKAKALNLDVPAGASRGRLIDLIFKRTVRHTLVQPAFLINPPVDIEPLAKRSSSDANRVERFQIVACGTELGKGFSELNDPLDQRARFEEQMKLRDAGDKEAQMIDEDYLEAMEYGMPPTAGFGMSERMFAILMEKPVRETVIFPLMKPKKA